MAAKEALEYLETEIPKRIESFADRRKFYRKGDLRITILSAAFSAITTFCIGVGQIIDSQVISIIALATSATMTVLVAIENFYNYRQRWIQNNDTLMSLYELRSDIQYTKALSNNNLSNEEINSLHNRYENILRAANESWRSDRSISKGT